MRIFVSYSLRCGITEGHLRGLRGIQRLHPHIFMYIDIFDNPEGYGGEEKSLYCLAHQYVMQEVERADAVLLLSDESASPWVESELELANRIGIPIITVSADEVGSLLDDCEKMRLALLKKLATYKVGSAHVA